MLSTSPGSNAASEDSAAIAAVAGGTPLRPATYFDGVTNRRHAVELRFGPNLDLVEDGVVVASWSYDDLRAADGGPGALRLKCVSSLPLARLGVLDPEAQAEIGARARFLNIERGGPAQTGRIVAWSFAAAVSILLIILYGLPFAGERLTPLIPFLFEQHIGAVAANQVRALLGGRTCTDAQGSAAFAKLVETLRQASHLGTPLQTEVLFAGPECLRAAGWKNFSA